MSDASHPVEPPSRLRPLTLIALLLTLAVEIGFFASWYGSKFAADGHAMLLDFDVFHLVGQMHWAGNLEEAYRFELFRARQEALSGSETAMPWTYPPPFDLVTAALALMSPGLAYLVFVSVTLAAYLLVLRRIAGGHFPVVLVCLFPILALTVLVGQNGFLTGSLIGLFALLASRGSRWAGLPLGLMVVKPHLALGIGVFLILSRRWVWIAQAALTAVGVSLLSNLVLGPGIWTAFLHGVRESGEFLEAGRYPLQRMTSVYAGLRSFGIESRIAFGIHAGVALCALAMVQVALVRGWRSDRALVVAVLATLLVSPYNYDYDLPILGIALALVLKALPAPFSYRLLPPALVLALFAETYPVAVTKVSETGFVQAWLTLGGPPVALAPFALVALTVLLLAVLWRTERAGAGASPGRSRPEGAAAPGLSGQ